MKSVIVIGLGLATGSASDSSKLNFVSNGQKTSISWDGTHLSVPGFARVTDLLNVQNDLQNQINTLAATVDLNAQAALANAEAIAMGSQLIEASAVDRAGLAAEITALKQADAAAATARADLLAATTANAEGIATQAARQMTPGPQGIQGIQGIKGETGATGAPGQQGQKGDNGAATSEPQMYEFGGARTGSAPDEHAVEANYCANIGKRLPTYQELCPNGCTGAGGGNVYLAPGHSWVPYSGFNGDYSNNGNSWVYISNDGGHPTCRDHNGNRNGNADVCGIGNPGWNGDQYGDHVFCV